MKELNRESMLLSIGVMTTREDIRMIDSLNNCPSCGGVASYATKWIANQLLYKVVCQYNSPCSMQTGYYAEKEFAAAIWNKCTPDMRLVSAYQVKNAQNDLPFHPGYNKEMCAYEVSQRHEEKMRKASYPEGTPEENKQIVELIADYLRGNYPLAWGIEELLRPYLKHK